MSSIMAAGRYIEKSGDISLCDINSLSILSNIIQNILDGYYQDAAKFGLDYIYLKDGISPPLRTNILGIGLGHGKAVTQITDTTGIHDCIDGVPGSIYVLTEMSGIVSQIALNGIQSITHKKMSLVLQQNTSNDLSISNSSLGKGTLTGESESKVELA